MIESAKNQSQPTQLSNSLLQVNFLHDKSFPNDKILDWSKLKAFADNNINVTSTQKFF